MTPDWLQRAAALKVIRPIDHYFACFMQQLHGSPSTELLLASCLVSYECSLGQAYIELAPLCNHPIFATPHHPGLPTVVAPALNTWIKALTQSPVVGQPGDHTPLILDQHRLYLARYWAYETRLTDAFKQRMAHTQTPQTEPLQHTLNTLFPHAEANPELNGQKTAAALAARQHLMMIFAPPEMHQAILLGRLLATLIMLDTSEHTYRIELAATTDTAALTHTLTQAKQALSSVVSANVCAQLPASASTLQHLLGGTYDAQNPLHLDLLVIDAAAMLDVALMARLTEALTPTTRLILLGDSTQLPAIRARHLFKDIGQADWTNQYSAAQTEYLQFFCPPYTNRTNKTGPTIQDNILLLRPIPG